ncbi:Uncharacterised protein [Metamycoplasma arthritidis]|uniref:Uncharacterized protein n=1 Tax=Metamycoplasma arthritidis (strain 158L3-1) TaxID=243272 RepID=B3PM60_META1|nr:hypothetical protein [Metamycoplasma arthritidis]ACF07112.1 hypothetical protein MARTH_orf191 [Metamycoplasma arthritidis 158L3-1]VEU78640.1 Uncharacterised protein [Metamycoplasma arthritidis]
MSKWKRKTIATVIIYILSAFLVAGIFTWASFHIKKNSFDKNKVTNGPLLIEDEITDSRQINSIDEKIPVNENLNLFDEKIKIIIENLKDLIARGEQQISDEQTSAIDLSKTINEIDIQIEIVIQTKDEIKLANQEAIYLNKLQLIQTSTDQVLEVKQKLIDKIEVLESKIGEAILEIENQLNQINSSIDTLDDLDKLKELISQIENLGTSVTEVMILINKNKSPHITKAKELNEKIASTLEKLKEKIARKEKEAVFEDMLKEIDDLKSSLHTIKTRIDNSLNKKVEDQEIKNWQKVLDGSKNKLLPIKFRTSKLTIENSQDEINKEIKDVEGLINDLQSKIEKIKAINKEVVDLENKLKDHKNSVENAFNSFSNSNTMELALENLNKLNELVNSAKTQVTEIKTRKQEANLPLNDDFTNDLEGALKTTQDQIDSTKELRGYYEEIKEWEKSYNETYAKLLSFKDSTKKLDINEIGPHYSKLSNLLAWQFRTKVGNLRIRDLKPLIEGKLLAIPFLAYCEIFSQKSKTPPEVEDIRAKALNTYNELDSIKKKVTFYENKLENIKKLSLETWFNYPFQATLNDLKKEIQNFKSIVEAKVQSGELDKSYQDKINSTLEKLEIVKKIR